MIKIEKERSLRAAARTERQTKEGGMLSRRKKQRVGHLKLRKQSRV